MPRAVRFGNYGGIDVLRIEDVPAPSPGAGELLVKVKAAGINPGEAKIREGLLHERWPATFPSGQGSDLAGVVEQVGEGVDRFAPGDEVIGFTDNRASQAELVLVVAENATPRPAGVGSLAVPLARRAGATVIGLASEPNHAWLEHHGVVAVSYGDGVADRIREAVDGRLDAFIDTVGDGYVDLALELGVEPGRIDTIVDFAAVQEHGIQAEGNAAGASAAVLAELAGLIEQGELELPIARVYPLDEVREAYEELERGHTHGKIVCGRNQG